MQFSLVEGIKSKPGPGLKGACIFCESQTISKCGKFKVWHWAHKAKSNCDQWWESETEWHRNWKNHFPESCQEIIHIDPHTNEKHIADVKTKNSKVIEFQNSPITQEESASRERFYKNMFWVVNGDRKGTSDLKNFNLSVKGLGPVVKSVNPLIITFHWSTSKLFERWSTSSVPVFLDFNYDEVFWLQSQDKNKHEVTVTLIDKVELIKKNGGIYEGCGSLGSLKNWIYDRIT